MTIAVKLDGYGEICDVCRCPRGGLPCWVAAIANINEMTQPKITAYRTVRAKFVRRTRDVVFMAPPRRPNF